MATIQQKKQTTVQVKKMTLLPKNILLFSFVLFSLLYHSSTEAKPLISGYYSSSSGKTIILNLRISTPAPTNLIVEQVLSSQNIIIASSPRAKKISKGRAKWLFRNTTSGNLSIIITLQAPLVGRISSVVRFRDPASSTFVESRISP